MKKAGVAFFDFLAGIIGAEAGLIGGFDRASVGNGYVESGIPNGLTAGLLAQMVADSLLNSFPSSS